MEPSHPDITPAHILATLIAGIPIVAHLLAAIGVYDVNARQQQALSDALRWAGGLAAALIAADAGVRVSRNLGAAGPARAASPGADPIPEPGDPDVLAPIPVHDGPVPPDRGDAKTAVAR